MTVIGFGTQQKIPMEQLPITLPCPSPDHGKNALKINLMKPNGLMYK
jgi:hypothetical protein